MKNERLMFKNEEYIYYRFNMKSDYSYNRAITLISLVITIILIILLAGVAINLSVGENGIFNKVKQAKEQYTESIAKEKLEMVLLDVIVEKQTNSEYNNRQFLDDMLKANGVEVQGDNVIIDNYIFILDRDNLGITQSLGQAQIKVTKEVQKYLGKNANDKYEAQLLIIVESNTNLQKVEIINPDGTTFEIETEQEKIAKDLTVEFDEEYKLEITDKTGKKETRTIVERSQEGIRTAEELAEFRDKVNTGLTYEGKMINLLKDIDLRTVCGKDVNGEEISWEPIGIGNDDINLCIEFKGQFKGNYHTIDNLYINTTDGSYQGLFGYIRNGKITGVIIGEHSNIIGIDHIGAIAGCLENSIILNCGNNANIQGRKNIGGICGYATNSNLKYCYNAGNIMGELCIAGICAWNCYETEISNCYNIGNITVNYAISTKGAISSGGIAGRIKVNSLVNYCCNLGIITNNSNCNLLGGIIGDSLETNGNDKEKKSSLVSNSYNFGNVISNGTHTGGIIGFNNKNCYVKNCYILDTIGVKYNDINATKNVGTSSSYLGKIVGCAYTNNSTYINNVGELSQMPTVYEIVNGSEETGLNSGASENWSNTEWTDERLQTPKLKGQTK